MIVAKIKATEIPNQPEDPSDDFRLVAGYEATEDDRAAHYAIYAQELTPTDNGSVAVIVASWVMQDPPQLAARHKVTYFPDHNGAAYPVDEWGQYSGFRQHDSDIYYLMAEAIKRLKAAAEDIIQLQWHKEDAEIAARESMERRQAEIISALEQAVGEASRQPDAPAQQANIPGDPVAAAEPHPDETEPAVAA